MPQEQPGSYRGGERVMLNVSFTVGLVEDNYFFINMLTAQMIRETGRFQRFHSCNYNIFLR